MSDDFEREKRKINKNHPKNKKVSKRDISEEQRFDSKSKKAFKNKIIDMRGEELWEDWENMEP